MRSNMTTALLMFAIGSVGARASTEPLPCSRLLTVIELATAAGAGFEDVGHEEPEAGKSECIWLLDRQPNPKAVFFTFWQRSAIAHSDLSAFFETQVKRAEAVHANKREMLDGIGAATALVPGKKPGAMAVLIVQTTAGVAYIETDYLERPQLISIAEAVVAP